MASSYTEQQVQALYAAYRGRPADPVEQQVSAYLLDEAVTNLEDLSTGFTYYDRLNPQDDRLDDQALVDNLYTQLFEREPDAGGLDYWAGRLTEGDLQRDALVPAMLRAAGPVDREASFAKFSIADYYADNTQDFEENRQLTLDNLRSNETLYADLQKLGERDTLDLAVVGESLEGRPLYRAEVGEGEDTLMIVSQQHGDEPVGTEALMSLLDVLSGDSTYAENLREEVTVVAMPRVNPDGFARWEQQVAGDQDLLDPRLNAAGEDLNRSYDASNPPNPDNVPEALAVLEVANEYQPDLFLDYHNQNNYRGDDGELDTMSIQWATNPEVDEAVSETGQRAAVAIADQLEGFDHAELSLFPGSDNPAIARNGLALDGTPTLLIEQRGLQEMDQIAQNGLETDYSALASALTIEGVLSMLGVIEALADDSFDEIDPAEAQVIDERGERVPFDEVYEPDQRDSLQWSRQHPDSTDDTVELDQALAQLVDSGVSRADIDGVAPVLGLQASADPATYGLA